MLTADKILEIIKKILDGHYNPSQLENLYNNAIERGYCEIENAAKNALVITGHPEQKRKFLAPIQEKVKNLAYEIAEQHGWLSFPNNEVDNGIKVGGDVRRGAVAQYYFSYKQKGWRRAVAFAVTQVDVESEIRYSVNSPGLMAEIHFSNLDDALELFNSELAEQTA